MRTAKEMRKLVENHEKSIKDEARVEDILIYLDEHCEQRAKDGFNYYNFIQLIDGGGSFPTELLTSKLDKLGYKISGRISQFNFYMKVEW